MSRTYTTKSIEIGSTLQALTGLDPSVSFDENGIATLEFPLNSEVTEIVMAFESGNLRVEPRTLLTVRNQLFRRVKGVRS